MKFKKSADKSNKTELPVIGGDAKVEKKHNNIKKLKVSKNLINKKSITLVLLILFVPFVLLLIFNFIDKNSSEVNNTGLATPAELAIIDQINSTKDPKAKSELYIKLAAEQQLNGKVQASEESAQKALEQYESASTLATAGVKFAQEGDYIKAAEYLNKASELAKNPDGSDSRDSVYYLRLSNDYKAKSNE